MDKFQITRFLRFASQITRPTIFSCLARFPSNQFTQSPTIRVSAYPVAKICHVRLPGRPNFSSRLPGNDIFLLSSNFIKKLRTSLPSLPQFTFQLTRPLTFLMSDYPVGQLSRPDHPAANILFSFRLPARAKYLVSAYPDTDGCLARRKGRTQREPRRAQPLRACTSSRQRASTCGTWS